MIELFPFKLPFKDTFRTSKGNFEFRDGILVCFTHQNHKHCAEISPLPGFSISTLETCTQIFKSNSRKIDEILIQISNSFNEQLDYLSIFEIIKKSAELSRKWIGKELGAQFTPEINFAIDHLIFQIFSNHISVKSDDEHGFSVPINASAKSLSDVQYAESLGIKTIKVKVGMNIIDELSLIKSLRGHFPDIAIRLDANAAWDLKQAISFIDQVKTNTIEYIEQPISVQELHENGHILRNLGVPIAADEAARSYSDILALIKNKSTDILIIKPPMIGSLENLLNICDLASKAKLPCVFTSTLDSAINRRFAAKLSFVFGSKKYAHGFGTGSLFKSDITRFDDYINNGNLVLASTGISELDLNHKVLGKQI